MKEKPAGLLTAVKSNWKTPAPGRYMTFREILSFSMGSMGEKLVSYCVSQLIISIGNVIIGNTIGIEPGAMYVIYLIGVASGFPLTALRAKMIDNTRSMKGKYRPYIVTMGIPTTVLGILFMYMPYERMTSFGKCLAVLLCNIGFQFFFYFYTDVFDSMINVLSPNSIERSDVLSIKSVIENFSPSIANILLPLAAKWITGENTLYNMQVYRTLYPPMLVLGFALSLVAYVNTEEKIVQAKTHVIRVRFSDAFRAIAHNRYFWIISLAGWLGFLESSNANILGWMYNYQNACSEVQYAFITAIVGNASFWPNLVAPFFIRKYGKKKVLVVTNVMNVFFLLLMLPVVRKAGQPGIVWALVGCLFINNFITSLGHLLGPSIQADIRDYQQYVTGERIDGMFAVVGLIGNVVSLATGSVLPAIYSRSGLNAETAIALGYDGANVYHVLYNTGYFVKICSVLVLASVVGAALNVIPYFFYDLTETDQKGMVQVLKIRALFEDHANGVLSDRALVETVDIIRDAEAFGNETPAALPPADGTSRKELKARQKEIKEHNEKIAIGKRVLTELSRFETKEAEQTLEFAWQIEKAGPDGFLSLPLPDKAQIKAMPRETPAQREARRNRLMQRESFVTAARAARKYYPEGLVPFDNAVLDALFKAEDDNALALRHAMAALKRAKEKRLPEAAAAAKAQIRQLKTEERAIAAKIKKASEEYTVYYRAAKPYMDACKLLRQSESYRRLDEITALYDGAKARIANEDADE
ncbi:MAG: MFS transporter [Clostridia bacterium]|nr:MFS transporter [Clostridia bacterium]